MQIRLRSPARAAVIMYSGSAKALIRHTLQQTADYSQINGFSTPLLNYDQFLTSFPDPNILGYEKILERAFSLR